MFNKRSSSRIPFVLSLPVLSPTEGSKYVRAAMPVSPLLLLAAALVALAVFFAHDAPRAQAQTAEVEVWSSNLTVGNLPPNPWRGYSSALNRGQLSDNDFVYEGVTYVVTNLTDRGNGAVLLELNKPIPNSLKEALTLTFRGRQLALADAVAPNPNYLRWDNTGWRFSLDDVVNVKLIKPATTAPPPPPPATNGGVPLPTLTASFSPDGPVNENWETDTANDLWSATLTARELSSATASAPAIVGCDDSNRSARCSSLLRPRNFTFKGERYTVKAISYNQRKVTADTTTLTVKTYPESLKLTLDKSIPESLQSCLTLHVGDTKFGLGEVRQYATLSRSTTNDVANDTVTWSDIGAQGWGLNWSAGDRVKLRLPNVGCLTLTLSEPVTGETSLQWRRGGTADLSGDYQRISLPTFAAGSTTASTPIKPVDDSEAEGCETIILDMTMWPGEDRAVHERFTVAIQDDDGGNACVGGG